MDEKNDSNQSVDGIKPTEVAPSSTNIEGFITPTRPAQTDLNTVSTPVYTSQEVATKNPEVEVAKLKAQKKGMSIWLTVLLVLIFAAIAATAVYFYQAAQSEDALNAEKTKTAQAQQALATQQQTATQQQITALNGQVSTLTTENSTLTTQNAALQKTIDTQNTYIKSLSTVAAQLKTTCGSACSSITIPPAPTTN